MKHQRSNKPLVWLLITLHVVMIYGCSVTNRITLPGNEIPVGSNFTIAKVILKDGEIIEFDGNGGMYVEKVKDGKSYRAIVGAAYSKNVEIDPDKVLEVRFEQHESRGAGTFLVGFLVGLPAGALGLYLIVAAAYSSH
jgi:hypothetical protein